jgi:hypothetical protein
MVKVGMVMAFAGVDAVWHQPDQANASIASAVTPCRDFIRH